MVQGKYRFQQAFEDFSRRKKNEQQFISGILGLPIGSGQNTVEVAGRDGFVYVRLRDNLNEVIQAYNAEVSPVYGLPVLVTRNPDNMNHYTIVGRDVARYSDWGTTPYLPRHGNQHSFNTEDGGGGDVVWVYGRQFMPLSIMPSGSAGSGGVIVEGSHYYQGKQWEYAGDTGTPDIIPSYLPTGTQARMVLVYLDENQNPTLLGGDTYFDVSLSGKSQIIPYLPELPDTDVVPLGAVRLTSGTERIVWEDIYDLRPYIIGDGFIPTGSSGHIIRNEGVDVTQRSALNFIGSNVWINDDPANDETEVIISGSAGGGGSTSPGGADTQVQFNDGGVFAGDSNFYWDKGADNLHVIGDIDVMQELQVSGTANLNGGAFIRGGALTVETVLNMDSHNIINAALLELENGDIYKVDNLRFYDTDQSHELFMTLGSDLTANRTFTINSGDADRSITLQGNPTLDDWFDQGVKTSSSPSFDGITDTSIEATNVAAGTTGERPVGTVADFRYNSSNDEFEGYMNVEGGDWITIIDANNVITYAQPPADMLSELADLSDPDADRIFFWDDSAPPFGTSTAGWLEASTGIMISGTYLTTQDDEINHNNLLNYAVDQHRVWENSIAQNIHDDNIQKSSITQYGYTSVELGITGTWGVREDGVQQPYRGFLNFRGDGVFIEDDAGNNELDIIISGSTGGGSGVSRRTIKDNGVAEINRDNLNFIGDGVFVNDDPGNNEIEIIISGSSGGGGGVSVHNNLSGLQGGVADEYFHLSSGTYESLLNANAQLDDLQTDGSPSFSGITDTSTEATNVAAGTTGQRPGGTVGDIRYNSSLGVYEIYPGSWVSILESADIGSSVQAWDAGLDDISGLAVTDGNFIVGDGSNWVAESGDTALTSLGLSTNLGDLTDDEVAQLENIGAVTISNSQWGYLGSMSGQPIESETNDLTAAVTWANVPDVNVQKSSITQYDYTANELGITGTWGIQDEGVQENYRSFLNFTGDNVWVEDDAGNDRLNVIISGSAGGGGVSTHNNLSGLQGGTADEYYHLSSGTYESLLNVNSQLDNLQTDGSPTFTGLTLNGNLSVKSQNEVRFYDNGNYVGFEAPALSADQIWVLPDADGGANEFLQTDGSGNLTWAGGAGGTDLTGLGTDNTIARWNGTDTLQDSGITIDDNDNLNSPGNAVFVSGTFSGLDVGGAINLSQSEDGKGIFLSGYDDVSADTLELYIDQYGISRIKSDEQVIISSTTAFVRLDSTSNIYAQLGDDAGLNEFRILNSGGFEVAYINSYGGVNFVSGTFSGLDLTGITDGNIPYMSASGFADSPLSTNGTDLDISGGDLDLDFTTNSNKKGIITKDGIQFIHNFEYGNNGTVTVTGRNTFIGESAGNFTIGATATETYHSSDNVGIGYRTGKSLTTGFQNVMIGSSAGSDLTSGEFNMLLGSNAGKDLTTGQRNVFIGRSAGIYTTTQSYNVYIGSNAGIFDSGGDDNTATANSIMIGHDTRPDDSGDSNEIVIGYQAVGQGSNTIMLGNSSVSSLYCYDTSISSPSDRRIKKDLMELEQSTMLKFINELEPITYIKKNPFDWDKEIRQNYDENTKRPEDNPKRYAGLIAQDVKNVVEKYGIDYELIPESSNGMLSVRYTDLIPALIGAVKELTEIISNPPAQ